MLHRLSWKIVDNENKYFSFQNSKKPFNCLITGEMEKSSNSKLANVFAHWARIRRNPMSKSLRTNWSQMRGYRSRFSCQSTRWVFRLIFILLSTNFLYPFKAISKQRSGDTADDFIEGLRHFDKDASGFISSAELRHLLTTLGEKLSDEEVEQLLNNQEDSQGNVNYEEFVRLVMNG